MKKFIAVCAVILLLIIALTMPKGIDVSGLDKSSYNAGEQNPNLVLSVENKAITEDTKELNLSMTNNSLDTAFSYGDREYTLEVKSKDEWYVYPIQGLRLEVGAFLYPSETHVEPIDMDRNHGELKRGKYRLVKTFHSHTLSRAQDVGYAFACAEFEIK